jgi:MSHA biogenesis protein MshL
MKHRIAIIAGLTLGLSSLAGAAAEDPAGGAVTASRPPASEARFDVTVEDAPARPFFQSLVEGTHNNILVHPNVTGRITLSLKQVTLEQVLDATRELYGYDYRRSSAGYVVLPAAVQSRTFQLSYLDLKRFGISNTRISSGQVTQGGNNTQYGSTGGGGATQTPSGIDAQGRPTDVTGTSILTRTDSDFWTGIEADLKALIGNKPDRSVIINRQSGVIIVHAMPNELRDVSDYLAQTTHTVTRQVVLEAKVLEVDLDEGYQAGINWAAVLQRGASTYTLGQAAPPGGFQVNPFTPPSAPTTVQPSYSGTSTAVAPGNPITGFLTNPLGGAFTIAADFKNFSTLIELLSSQGHTRVLSSPRVSTLHNQQAIIKAGTDEFFVTGVESNTVTGTATSTSRNVQLTPFFSGVALDVTPQIGPDDSVTLHVHPTISEVTDQTKSLTIDGSVDTIPLALSQIRESDNIVRARSGQLIIIGGLMREQVSKIHYKTPLLGDIPGLGKLFRSEQNQTHTVELVILLRPIVVTDADWPALVNEPQSRVQDLNKRGDFGKLDYPPAANSPNVDGRQP